MLHLCYPFTLTLFCCISMGSFPHSVVFSKQILYELSTNYISSSTSPAWVCTMGPFFRSRLLQHQIPWLASSLAFLPHCGLPSPWAADSFKPHPLLHGGLLQGEQVCLLPMGCRGTARASASCLEHFLPSLCTELGIRNAVALIFFTPLSQLLLHSSFPLS